MADAVLHIKDSYYFELPKFLWSDYESLEDVPRFLREAHPHESLDRVNHDLKGKFLIPQPFGTLKNLYAPESGFCISRFMIIELVVAVFLVLMFRRLALTMKQQGDQPVGRFRNCFESMLLFIRDEVARPAIGGHGHEKDADKFVPVLWTLFFFILTLNMLGLVPWVGTATGAFGTTLSLACVTFFTGLIAGSRKFGVVGFWTNMVPHMDLPPALAPLRVVIFLIELVGTFIKHAILGVRLLANMVAGHLVLFGILGIIASTASESTGTWATATTISVVGSILFCCLELFVAMLQAYIFTFLSALFIGAATHSH